MKPVTQITDRAKRLRAQSLRVLAASCECSKRSHGHGARCGSRSSLGIGHRDGDESNGRPSNLFTVCKSCNAKQAVEDKRRGRGVRTRQYNPRRRRNAGATNLAQYVQAAVEHSRGAHDAGGRILHETPKAKRREFAREIAWRKGYRNPASEIMSEWRAGKLRTSAGDLVPRGKAGEKQARAILLSELRREGKIGPRQNPEGSADELFRKFHGVKPDNHLVFDVPLIDPYGSHPEIAQFGLLVRLVVGEGIEVSGDDNSDALTVEKLTPDAWNCEISFVPSLADYKRKVRELKTQADIDQLKSWLRENGTPDVAGATDADQIYIVGGNQDISAKLGLLGADASKETIDCGFCYLIEYFTQKRFDRMSPIDYYHSFGEVSGVQPRLMFWRKVPMLQLVGGEYTIKPSGINN